MSFRDDHGLDRAVLLVFAVLSLSAAGVAAAVVAGQRTHALAEASDEALGTCRVKAEQFAGWHRERLGDARVILADRYLARGLLERIREGDGPPGTGTARYWMRGLAEQYGYRNVLLLDGEGRLVSAVIPEDPRLHPAGRTPPDSVWFNDLARDPATGRIRSEISVPLADPPGSPPGGWVVLRMEPDHCLFTTLTEWPESTQVGTTLLARLEGDSVTCLAAPRTGEDAVRVLRLPRSRSGLPAVRAALGYRGALAGPGLDGRPALAGAARVPGTSWAMVTVMDRAAILAPVVRQASEVAALLIAALLGAGYLLTLAARNRERHYHLTMERGERERTALTRHYELFARHSTDVIILADETGSMLDVNDRAEEVYGYSRAELLGRSFQMLRPPEARVSLEEYLRPLWEQGSVRIETVHQRRDGSRIPVDVSVGLIVVDGRPFFQGIVRDMSEWAASRDQLRESETRFRAAAERFPGILAIFDSELRYTYANGTAQELSGMPLERALGRTNEEVFPEEFYAPFLPLLKACRDTGRPQQAEGDVRLQGRWFRMEIHVVPIPGADGRPNEILGFAYDLTALARAEEAARAKEQSLALALRAARAGAWSGDPATGRVSWDDRTCELFGVRPGSFGGTMEDFLLHVHQADRESVAREMQQYLARGGEFSLEFRVPDGRGGDRWLSNMGEVVLDPDGSQVSLSGITMDVTERKSAFENLRKLARAVDCSPVSVLITDAEGVIEYVNPRFCETSGYSAGEVLGQNPRILNSGRQDKAFYGDLWSTVTAGREWHGEFWNRRKNGELFAERAAIAPVVDDGGVITHFVGLKEDVTQIRELEEQFRQAQKMEAVGRLAGGVAHDFNNLLTVIGGFTTMAMRSVQDGSPAHSNLLEVLRASERAANLTRQLLAFSRRQVQSPRVLNLNELLTDMTAMIRRLIGEEITLRTSFAPDLGRIKADPGQIEQVLLNLVVNARDAVGGPGTVEILTGHGSVDEEFAARHPGAAPGPHVVLTVRDTGCGMDTETRAHIFEPFFTTKGPDKGTGLGLATLYGIVQQSRGAVEVESEPGAGTAFRIYLPVCAEAPVARRRPDSSAGWGSGNGSILVVEDNDGVRELVRETLTAAGYRVAAVSGAGPALALAEESGRDFDLLLTDLVMPEVDGCELADRITASRPGLAVLFMSGYPDQTLSRHGLDAGDAPFIRKPFAPAELVERVHAVIAAGRLRKAG